MVALSIFVHLGSEVSEILAMECTPSVLVVSLLHTPDTRKSSSSSRVSQACSFHVLICTRFSVK